MGREKSGTLLVYGASGHGKVVAEAALQSGWKVIGFGDDDPGKRGALLLDLAVCAVGREEAVKVCQREDASFVVAIGDNSARRRVYRDLKDAGLTPACLVHPAATVSSRASLGAGTVVFAGVVVNPDTKVGEDVILNTCCSLDHDNWIGDHVHVSPGAHLGGGVRVGEGTHIGLGAAVRNNLTIASWVTIGMGSVVLRDLPGGVVAYGVPARVVKERA